MNNYYYNNRQKVVYNKNVNNSEKQMLNIKKEKIYYNDILRMKNNGMTQVDISTNLNISIRTVKNYYKEFKAEILNNIELNDEIIDSENIVENKPSNTKISDDDKAVEIFNFYVVKYNLKNHYYKLYKNNELIYVDIINNKEDDEVEFRESLSYYENIQLIKSINK
jgi:DNA-binding transcriptional regulator LsrR (DeoR family)